MEAAGGGITNGSLIDQWNCNGTASQAWVVTNLGSGQYQIIGVQSGLSLDVPLNSTNEGVDLELWTPNGSVNQQWTITPASGGCYTIQGAGSGLLLNVTGSSTAQGALVEQRSGSGPASQWSLRPTAHLPLIQEPIVAGQVAVRATLFQGQTCVLLASTNLAQWWPVATNTAAEAGALILSDGVLTGDKCRFYRVQFQQ